MRGEKNNTVNKVDLLGALRTTYYGTVKYYNIHGGFTILKKWFPRLPMSIVMYKKRYK